MGEGFMSNLISELTTTKRGSSRYKYIHYCLTYQAWNDLSPPKFCPFRQSWNSRVKSISLREDTESSSPSGPDITLDVELEVFN